MRLVRVTHANWTRFQAGVDAIEAGAQYPLGRDFFRIDHGKDYFAFFERLGKLHYFAWMEDDRVAAVAAGIVRTLPLQDAQKRAWYLCDLKVHPDFRGKHIPLRMLMTALPCNYFRCPRGYAISMNPAGGMPNRTVKILKRSKWVQFGAEQSLLIWSLDHEEMSAALPILQRHRGSVTFQSLRGIKDIVLQSTGQPMNLLHAQFGPLASGATGSLQEGAVHMFCSPAEDPLAREMERDLNVLASASATIISHRMTNFDWRWVLTSDI